MTKLNSAQVVDIDDKKNSSNKEAILKKNIKNFDDLDDLKPEYSRDSNLTDFGKATLVDRYLLPGEKFQDMFMRV